MFEMFEMLPKRVFVFNYLKKIIKMVKKNDLVYKRKKKKVVFTDTVKSD